MRNLFTGKRIKIDQNSLQDLIFLISIFLFFTVLIIGLFPGNEIGIVVGKNFFILSLMTVPVIAAIYFISISFRRRIYREPFDIGSSIKNKMAMAFIFVAIVPTLIIVLASNNFINKTLSKLLSDRTFNALKESVSLSELNMDRFVGNFKRELYSLNYLIEKNIANPQSEAGRKRITDKFKLKGISALFFRAEFDRYKNRLFPIGVINEKNLKLFMTFLAYSDFSSKIRLDKISAGNTRYLLGSLKRGNYLIVLYMPVPAVYESMKTLFASSLDEYRKHRYLKAFFRSSSGIFMLILTIVIVGLSILVSFILSRNITKPVLELTESTKELANGNFNVRLTRKSDDELSILYRAFNFMVKELENNRKIVFQKQKLEAWREMATRLVHEIKNPLTPIRLSAERMRKRYAERHEDIDRIITTGTETIIEEVDVLMTILSEFTKFARLPEMKPGETDLNRLVENCINLFKAHENIKFELNLDRKIPPVYIDKILFNQVITNLIQNAVDAVNEIGEITVKTELLEDIVRIRIIDNGMGIKEEYINKIFEPGRSYKSSGTGLGLSIVEMIVLEHNGKVYCNSEFGKGAEFIVDIPILKNN